MWLERPKGTATLGSRASSMTDTACGRMWPRSGASRPKYVLIDRSVAQVQFVLDTVMNSPTDKGAIHVREC